MIKENVLKEILPVWKSIFCFISDTETDNKGNGKALNIVWPYLRLLTLYPCSKTYKWKYLLLTAIIIRNFNLNFKALIPIARYMAS